MQKSAPCPSVPHGGESIAVARWRTTSRRGTVARGDVCTSAKVEAVESASVRTSARVEFLCSICWVVNASSFVLFERRAGEPGYGAYRCRCHRLHRSRDLRRSIGVLRREEFGAACFLGRQRSSLTPLCCLVLRDQTVAAALSCAASWRRDRRASSCSVSASGSRSPNCS